MAYDQYGNFIPNPVGGMGQPFGGQQLPVQNTTPVFAPQQQGYQGMQMGGMPASDFGASALADALRANTAGEMKDKDFDQRLDMKMNKMYDIGNKAGAMYDKIGNFFS